MSINKEDIVNSISKMNILELTELTDLISTKFNISTHSIQTINKSNNENTATEKTPTEKTTYTITLTSFGDNKLNVIKTIRTIMDLGLKEAKDFVEKLPAIIKENIQKTDVEKIKTALEASGAKIEIK